MIDDAYIMARVLRYKKCPNEGSLGRVNLLDNRIVKTENYATQKRLVIDGHG